MAKNDSATLTCRATLCRRTNTHVSSRVLWGGILVCIIFGNLIRGQTWTFPHFIWGQKVVQNTPAVRMCQHKPTVVIWAHFIPETASSPNGYFFRDVEIHHVRDLLSVSPGSIVRQHVVLISNTPRETIHSSYRLQYIVLIPMYVCWEIIWWYLGIGTNGKGCCALPFISAVFFISHVWGICGICTRGDKSQIPPKINIRDREPS